MEDETVDAAELDPYRIEALFAADLEDETVEVPGWPGSWVRFCHLDAEGDRKYVSTGQSIRFSEGGGMAAEVHSDPEKQEVHLLLHTVMDFEFTRTRKDQRSGEEFTETTKPPAAKRFTQAWIDGCTGIFKRISPALRRWMVREAKRVNGMAELDLGNLPASSSS